jgi:hypothetical protein
MIYFFHKYTMQAFSAVQQEELCNETVFFRENTVGPLSHQERSLLLPERTGRPLDTLVVQHGH